MGEAGQAKETSKFGRWPTPISTLKKQSDFVRTVPHGRRGGRRGPTMMLRTSDSPPRLVGQPEAALRRLSDHMKKNYSTVAHEFTVADTNHSGELEPDELHRTIEGLGVPIGPLESAAIFDLVDTNQTGTIERAEFLFALEEFN